MEMNNKPIFGFAEGFKVEIACVRNNDEIIAAIKGIKKYIKLLSLIDEIILFCFCIPNFTRSCENSNLFKYVSFPIIKRIKNESFNNSSSV